MIEKLPLRFRDLRKRNGYSQREIAEMLDISTSAYGFYEQGKSMPGVDTVVFLSELYDVSTDYLLGHSDSPHKAEQYHLDIEQLLNNIEKNIDKGILYLSLDGRILDDEIQKYFIQSIKNMILLVKFKLEQ